MLLANKTAIIHGAGGAIGGAVARAFAREGAIVFLAGRTLDKVEAVAKEIAAAGGKAETAQVDALDERAVEQHTGAVADKTGRIDISFNASGIPQQGVQGIPLVELSADSFTLPVMAYTKAHFLTATAAARRMVGDGSGVILTLTSAAGRMAIPLMGGMAPAWGAVEALSHSLAAELGPRGIRVVCLRPNAMPETATITEVFGLHANGAGTTREQFQALLEGQTPLRRLQTLTEVANVAAFLASDQASAMTGTVANLSGGIIVD
jgi:NAD(P)-dependent dehydrogenase (short-subunit alcohol dehydrogenase family)